MTTLHTFGCSITQGHALPDVVKPLLDAQGNPLSDQAVIELDQRGEFNWEDIHILAPSRYAWPQVLADQLGIPLENHARRGACFQQIARQCAVNAPRITRDDIVIVMWTYLSRLSLQWPARTSVPFCNIADPNWGWKTVILGMNKFFGLSGASAKTTSVDERIQDYIERATKQTYLDPLGVYNRYYNSMVLQTVVDGHLRSTGARVIHLSVETDSLPVQLEQARQELDPSLREPYVIPDPGSWYTLDVDHDSCWVILDPDIPLAPNDMHPSVEHHQNFARHIHGVYFS